MNWDALGAVGETIGALAVVISLLYVGAQIRQNNRQSQSDSTFAWAIENNRFLEWTSSPPVATVLVKLRNDEELSEIEEFVARAFVERLLNNWWSAENAFQNGVMDIGTYETVFAESSRYTSEYPRFRSIAQSILAHYGEMDQLPILKPLYE